MTAALSAAVARAVVADGQLDVAVVVANEHLGVAGPRVLERVRQTFLHEPVGREVEAGRELHRVAFDLELDRQARLARLRDEPVEVLEARLRRESRCLLRPAQHADEPAHLGQRLAPGLLDDLQRLALALLLRLEQPAHARRLDGHHADAVADDVVELARDPRTLLGDGCARLLLACALESLGSLLRLVGLPQLVRRGRSRSSRRCRR